MKPILIITLALTLAGCAKQVDNPSTTSYSDIKILKQGQSLDSDPTIASACKDFSLSTESIKAFFTQAETITTLELHNEHDILPCYSKGTLVFKGKQYSWLIRAGGTGELSSDDEATNKVCSVENCANIPNLH